MKPSEGRGSLICNDFAPPWQTVAGQKFFLKKRIDREVARWLNNGTRGRGPAVFILLSRRPT